jgi:ATP-dependent DNA helicase RecQ
VNDSSAILDDPADYYEPAPFAPLLTESTPLPEALQATFGFDTFRPLQEEACAAAMSGRDVLVVMPTGAGKSLCFQLPALLTPGLTLVISPLVALMRDQVDALNRRPEIARYGCAALSSLQSSDEQWTTLQKVGSGEIRILYVAPERFRSQAFLDTLRRAKVSRFVVDEAHCISEWGHDFRPDYLSLLPVIESLGRPPVIAVTATATTRVQQSIAENLGLGDPIVLVGGFNRPNLHYSVRRFKSDKERREKLIDALAKLGKMRGNGLIYVPTRKLAEEVGEAASKVLATVGKRSGVYHAGLLPDERNAMQNGWLTGDIHLLVATNAFGMGIDKPDVRYVIHYGYPDSLESYYQEAGRAGRDGAKSRCIVLTCFTDRRTREWFIENDTVTPPDVEKTYNILRNNVEGADVRMGRGNLTRTLDFSPTKLRLVIAELERSNLIQKVAETNDEIIATMGPQVWAPHIMTRIRIDLAKQRAERLRRLDEMTDYCKTTECRRRTVLSYFGDREEVQVSEYCCDNCERPAAEEVKRSERFDGPNVQMPADIAAGSLHDVLQGIDALRPSVGKGRLSQILRGATSQHSTKGTGALFGCLKGASKKAVDTFIDHLVEENLLRAGDEDDYFVYTVTRVGRDVWQEQRSIAIPVPGFMRPGRGNPGAKHNAAVEAPNGEADEALVDALRAWRRSEAFKGGFPPYCVFGDKTLFAIATQAPRTLDELGEVIGIGPEKLTKYGNSVLEVVREIQS